MCVSTQENRKGREVEIYMPFYIPACLLLYLTWTRKARRWIDRFMSAYLPIYLAFHLMYKERYRGGDVDAYLQTYLFT